MVGIRRIILAVVVMFGLAMGGCQIPQRLNGVYEGRRSLTVNPGTDPVVADQLARVRLTAHEDGHAVLSDQGVPIEGTVTYGSKSATFTPERIAGVSINLNDPNLVAKYTADLVPKGKDAWMYDGVIIHLISPR